MKRTTLGWIAVAVQGLLLVALVIAPTRRPLTSLWPPDAAGVVGLVILGAGVVVLAIAARTLASALTPNPVPLSGQILRTTGVYGVVRHPIYSAVLLIAFGYTVALGSWWQVGVSLVLVMFFLAKAHWEDSLLAEQYGDQWHAWSQRTGALVPRFGHR